VAGVQLRVGARLRGIGRRAGGGGVCRRVAGSAGARADVVMAAVGARAVGVRSNAGARAGPAVAGSGVV
jgi:hypothetical protein